MVAVAAAEDATSIFGKDGIATQSLGTHFEETQFSSVEARPDGGIVAQRNDQLESYLANGAPDPAAPPQRVSESRKVFPLAGGKSLVAVRDKLTRVNADGGLDPGFGGTGTIKAPFWTPQAAAELPSGKLLIASVESGGTHTFFTNLMVAAVNQDGSIDRDFGSKGVLMVSLSDSSRLESAAVVSIVPIAEGGALVVGGSFLFELRADGSPNPGFGSAGLVTELPRVVGGRVLADGSIELVGSVSGPNSEDLAVLHYTAAGSPDPGFGDKGLRTFDFGSDEEARTASWAEDGSVVLGGSSFERGDCSKDDGCQGVPLLVAFDPSGGLDPGFGDGGVLRLAALAGASQNWNRDGVNAITRRPDGSIVAVGGVSPSHTVAFLAALSSRGALLPGFGEGGIARVRRAVPATQQLAGLVRLANGKLLAAGTTDVGFDRAPVLIRYDADGGLDSSFGGAGYVPLEGSNVAMGFAVNAAGQAMVGVYDYPHSHLLLRAGAGAAIPTFGTNGAVQLPSRVLVEALGFAKNGDAVVVGKHDVAGDAEPGMILRFLSNGRPDSGFGRNGRVAPRPPGGGEMRAMALMVGGKGGMLVGGSAGRRYAAGRRFTLTKLLPDGGPDHRFGAGGWSFSNAGGAVESVRLDHTGSHLYLAGVVRNGDRLRVVLLRFGEDGRPDLAFGDRGRRTIAISKPAKPTAIVPVRNGTLVILNKGFRPLLLFRRDGKVRRLPVGSRARFVENVRATVSGGRLILGWNGFSHAIGRAVYHLASRPLR
jgi:uncharacterized delta-60 repeat protein